MKVPFHFATARRFVFVALVVGASWAAGLHADRALRAALLQHARIAATAICPDHAAALTGTAADRDTAIYRHFRERLAQIRDALPDCRFAYLMARRPDGAVVFLADGEPEDSPDFSPPGQVYTNRTATLLAALDQGQAGIEGPLADPWGVWVSAMAPVALPDRSRPVVLGLDVDARRWKWIVASQAAVPAGLGAVAILLAWLAAELLANRRALRRHQAELETSEHRFAELAERSRTMVWEVDAQGLYTYVSPACLPILGYRPDEMVGRLHFYELHFPEGSEAFKRAVLRRIASNEQVVNEEIAVRAKDGRLVWLLTNGFPMRNADGTLRGYRGNNVDVTARKQAEADLRASEAQKKTILDHIPASIALLDPELRVLWANRTAAASANRQPEDMVGTPCHVFWGDPQKPCENCPAVEAVRTRRESHEIVRTPDGRVWEESGVPLLDDAGHLAAVVEIAIDVTARTATEQRMRELLAESAQARQALLGILEDHDRAEADLKRLATAIQQSADSIVVTDARGTIQYVNPAFEAVTGYARAEAIGQNPRILQSGRQDAAFYRQMWDVLASGRTWKGRFVNRRKDGALYTEDAVISPVFDAQGHVVNFVAVKRDVSEQLHLAAQLNQAQKMDSIGRLAGGVAHDFNNMLTVILGHAEMKLAAADLDPALRDSLEEIRHAATNSVALTRQLLAFARQQTIAPRLLDLNAAVKGSLQMLRRLIGENVELAWQPAAAAPFVKADPAQIDQILVNLCLNARDAISGAGHVAIETGTAVFDAAYCARHAGAAPGDYARLAVRDDGCGMDEETLAHVFEPFYTTKAPGAGIGLGLSMVYGAVKQNNGYVDVASSPGQGTVFHVYLPLCAGPEPVASPAPPASPVGGRKTILLVEDEPAILAMAAQMLDGLGYDVRAARTPAEAIRLVQELPGDLHLLITDVVMPGMNGRDLARTLDDLRPGLRHLYMSGYTADVIARNGILDDHLHFLHKPFSLEELAAKVSETLES